MATGDMKNNLMKLLREIRRMKIQIDPDVQSLSIGSPSSFLTLLHAAMMHYSLPLANWFTQHGYDLYGRSDLRFLQELYRVLRDVFNYRPKLTREQFLADGFAERKVLMTRDVLLFCQAKNSELVSQATSSSIPAKKRRAGGSSQSCGNHGNTTTVPKQSAEVLTIQERSGVGSAWSESTKNFKVDKPSSSPVVTTPTSLPPTMTPPTSFKLPNRLPVPANELDVTITSPSPPPLRSSSPHMLGSTPPLQSSSPTLVDQDTSMESITACVVRHESPHSDTELPLPTSNEGGEERESSPPPKLESWSSLPLREGEGITEKEGGHWEAIPEVVGSRVEELTKMVEKLSAKFVLLETQLKLSQLQMGQSSVEPDLGSCHESERLAERKTAGEGTTGDAMAGGASRGGRRSEGRKQPLRDITGEQVMRQPHPSIGKVPRPSPVKGPHTLPETESRPSPMMSFVSSEATPPYPRIRRVHHYTDQSFCMATPSTQEETNRLIESLRARAKETKEFLHLANSRLIQTSELN